MLPDKARACNMVEWIKNVLVPELDAGGDGGVGVLVAHQTFHDLLLQVGVVFHHISLPQAHVYQYFLRRT